MPGGQWGAPSGGGHPGWGGQVNALLSLVNNVNALLSLVNIVYTLLSLVNKYSSLIG